MTKIHLCGTCAREEVCTFACIPASSRAARSEVCAIRLLAEERRENVTHMNLQM